MPERDMDLVRRILAEVQEAPYDMDMVELQLDDYDESVTSYHVLLLQEAGLLEATDERRFGRPIWKPVRLTWDGHEFLEASRDDSRWERAKKLMREQVGGMSFEVLKATLVSMMKSETQGLI